MKALSTTKTKPVSTRTTNCSRSAASFRHVEPLHLDEPSHSGHRILLVDDDPTVLASLHNVLQSEGYVVVPAENGQEAVDLAAHLAVDLALLDLNMPVKNGWDTFEQLTREHPLLPVIIATARPNQLFMAASAGVGALLEKPMDMPTLLQTMRRLLAESAEQRLGRLAGKTTEFHYKPATTIHKHPGLGNPPGRRGPDDSRLR